MTWPIAQKYRKSTRTGPGHAVKVAIIITNELIRKGNWLRQTKIAKKLKTQ